MMKVLQDIRQIGYRIAGSRSERGCSQEDVALSVGISRNTYGDIERGARNMKVSTLCAILQFLEVRPDEILLADEEAEKEADAAGQLAACMEGLTPYEQSRLLEAARLMRLGLIQARGEGKHTS